MSSFKIKLSRCCSSIFCQISRNKARTLCSSQIRSLHDSKQDQIDLDSGISSFLLKTIKNPSVSSRVLSGSSFFGSQNHHFLPVKPKSTAMFSGCGVSRRIVPLFCPSSLFGVESSCRSDEGLDFTRGIRFFSTHAAIEPSTSDGLTVDRIVANQWTILDESESDWKSHAAAIAQSIQVIKRRLQWKKLTVRLNLLSLELNKPDLWDEPVHAGKINREHGSLMGKMGEVKAFERELLEHIDMIKLAREENDTELEAVGSHFLF